MGSVRITVVAAEHVASWSTHIKRLVSYTCHILVLNLSRVAVVQARIAANAYMTRNANRPIRTGEKYNTLSRDYTHTKPSEKRKS